MKTAKLASLAAALGLGLSLSVPSAATVLITNNNALITAFQVGATVNTLEALPGLPTATIADGTPVPSINQVYKINGAHFHSGGASFNNLAGNPGAPSSVLRLIDTFADGNARSGLNVLAPTHAVDAGDPANATVCFDGTCFFEIEFASPVAKFGAFVGFGSVQVLVKDRIKLADGTDDVINLEFFSLEGGEFFGVTSATANIDSITIAVSSPSTTFFLDDITIGATAGGGGGNTVPEPGTAMLFGLGLLGLMTSRKLRQKSDEN
jgi:PEP-CTERM motif